MSIRYLPHLDHERWYVLSGDHGADEGRPSWQHRYVHLYGPNSGASAEWNLLGRNGFGFGFQFGRNGGESDLGLDIYLGRVASLWLRLRAPWTRWARVSEERDPKGWYYARHTGIRLFPHSGRILTVNIEDRAGTWSRGQPWWHEFGLTTTTFMGRNRSETVEGKTGTTQIPLPEGNYPATWVERTIITRYTRPLGTIRDRVLGPRRHRYVDLEIEGGIPVEGKGENSYDCGMDGVCGCLGRNLEEAIGNAVSSVLRDRQRYGGPHDLPRPMTIREAETL